MSIRAADLQKKLLIGLARAFIKRLPNKTSRNSRRLQFFFNFALLVVYAFIKKIHFMPYEIHRTARQQNDRWKTGRELPGKIVTNADGYKKKSRHQLWEAGDGLVLSWNGNAFRAQWTWRDVYEVLGAFWEELPGCEWGGYWKERGITKFDDPYHFQLKK